MPIDRAIGHVFRDHAETAKRPRLQGRSLRCDLRPVDHTREQEAERLLALGASHLADHRRFDSSGWITLADPEGNEFCILPKDPASSGATT